MWKEILLNYGIFLLELLTVFGVIAVVVMMILDARKQPENGTITLTNLTEKFAEQEKALKHSFLSEAELKHQEKLEKKAAKEKAKAEKKRLKEGLELAEDTKSRLFVLNFHGDLHASNVASLRKEIDAVLSVANPAKDSVLLKLESPGGVVHGYGLAASQLQRLKKKQIPLTIAVDKVAASGGYMMACVADKIVAAPFAIIGSVGVVAQVPNIHRLLKKHDIDVDVMTAGEYKRTVTLVGENTEKGKQKFQQELEETHALFKTFVIEHRPQLEIEKIATGEHWFGQQALALNLVDEINTSDDFILNAIATYDVIEIKYQRKKKLAQRVGEQVESSVENVLSKLWYKSRETHL
ncbi:protease sohB [Bibersteinia trehalosi USDA-ARS-USMARC-188]|uniref:Protease sohB n=5 Tax=Bibersteinia trehalosi TaxID=47735 RepID=W0R685_BIBTR|nr:protease SohB [Bibersteinia trehalosi]AGH37990.1 protease sohB [Bibersteinia trehalosi USDA-ARS-USMARC-192]AHG82210.1 protease sohB [Bibersteinia trehalosi USDA-ARS-USMARC-188]AHG84523.1 protease sohB [Bibersteinia trehalosi USDA-ARS-USMARC-189]AHG85977.1 protease sohB [Bibersteinia trehalosi USDA-ARS-USMARC-190]OAQ15488.1 peptidase [Bibersteinia trehalosi Y31]